VPGCDLPGRSKHPSAIRSPALGAQIQRQFQRIEHDHNSGASFIANLNASVARQPVG
jgi:hypothetical protein